MKHFYLLSRNPGLLQDEDTLEAQTGRKESAPQHNQAKNLPLISQCPLRTLETFCLFVGGAVSRVKGGGR